MSLGVDLVPRKVCSLDCVYCEVGKTTKLTTHRMEYVPLEKIKQELTHYFAHNPDPDFVTFSGSGEPTLNSRIGEVLQHIRHLRSDIAIAVLTNGTLLSDPSVRKALLGADVVLPSLDAATQGVFEKINRPEGGLAIDRYIQGIVDFRNDYKGKIWLEVFILPGYNDSESELKALRDAVERISPNAVQLNTLDRPGTLADLRGATRAELKRVADLWQFENMEIIAASPKRKNIQSYRSDTEAAILETISRRPCTLDDLVDLLGMHLQEINKYLDVLEGEGAIETVELERGIFYRVKE
jgi:wyosine [tRNA(Phe)-imidazoG37] synthetase (radical SAM superfamily)